MTQLKLNSITKACLIMVFCIFSLKPKAQEIIESPSAKLLTKFKFEMLSGGIIILHATLDNYKDSLNFVLDTGSGGISLDSLTCAYYGFTTVPSDKMIRGIGGVKAISFAMNHTLNLPHLEVKNLDFHINDYALLTSVYGMKIDGIIGFSFLRRYIVSLDYDDFVISVYSPGSFKYPRGGHVLKPSFSSIPSQPLTVTDAKTINSKFYFDSGAGLCFLLTDDFAQDSNVMAKNKRLIETMAEGLGGKRPMRITVMKSVKIGPYKFKKVPSYVFNDEFNVTAYPSTGGLIGNDLLRRFNVILNYPDQSIFIKPNKSYDHPFDYSYTGFGIYFENDEVVVDDVIPGSPGEKAGIKPGDKILGVNGNFSNNVQVYRGILQNADSKIPIFVMRDGVAVLLTLKVRNILDKR